MRGTGFAQIALNLTDFLNKIMTEIYPEIPEKIGNLTDFSNSVCKTF